MKLLIDSGNSRIKWALIDGKDWARRGVLPVARVDELSQHIAGHCGELGISLRGIEQVWVSNVANEKAMNCIRNAVMNTGGKLHVVEAQQEQCGVRNGYTRPSQLGSDRWASLIAAWHLVQGECLVVNCGTATTIDALSGLGEFSGGLILPGVDMMLGSLSAASNRLQPGRGQYVPFPRNTADAMYSGAIQASCGAIQRQHALLSKNSAPVVLSGGAAALLQGHLLMPLKIAENLVLQGLLIIAQEASEA